MKQLSELGISPTPWTARHNGRGGISYVVYDANNIPINIACRPDAIIIKAAPKMYERLRQSTNEIECVIQFVKNKDIKAALRELAEGNKAVLAEAAGESEVK